MQTWFSCVLVYWADLTLIAIIAILKFELWYWELLANTTNKNMIYLKLRDREVHPSNGTEKRATKNMQLFLQHCCNGVEKRCCVFYPAHVQTCQQPDLVQARFEVGGKTRNIAIQLVLQRCCKTSCMFFVARFSVPWDRSP